MSAPLSTALAIARTYLNDDQAIQFPDAVLIPKAQEAHRELQEELWMCGSPVVRGEALLAYTTPGTTFPTLPTDFLCPYSMFENASASTVNSAGWTPMTEAFNIPLGTAVAATLGWWAWRQENIIIAGSSASRAVYLYYRRLITLPVQTTDLIGILFGESYMGARTAALTAGTLGNADMLAQASAMATANLAKVVTANRGSQKPTMKP